MDKTEKIKRLCEEKQIRMIDFKMTDIDGRWRHKQTRFLYFQASEMVTLLPSQADPLYEQNSPQGENIPSIGLFCCIKAV